MPTVDLFNREGQKVGDIQLSENVFAVEVNESVLHQVVVAQLANKRQGTQSTKTRAEVSGVEENLGDKKEQVEQDKDQQELHNGFMVVLFLHQNQEATECLFQNQ